MKKNIVTRSWIPQFAILNSLIHLQSRDVTEQGGKITLEKANCTQEKISQSQMVSISILCGHDSIQAL